MTALRSAGWFGGDDRNGFIHRSWMKSQGFPDDLFEGERPVIGIANSYSELTPCNAHLREVCESVKRGVWEAGGFPLEFPTMSLGEPVMRPTTMLFRNLMSMEVEECIRANPLDGVVLLSGCDKTTPAMLMGAASVDLPTIMVTGGPMLNGKFAGRDIGSGTAVWQLSDELRAGRIDRAEYRSAEACMSRSHGHCMTMGTASTMACLAEALGMQLPGSAAIPAVDSRRYTTAQLAGRRIVGMVAEDLRMSRVVSRESFENAVRVNAAIGGSTNAIIHLIALAGRLGVELSLADFDELARDVPLLVDLMPSGRFLMEDFYYAGGLPAVLAELRGLLHEDAMTVTGRTLRENVATAGRVSGTEAIRPLDEPLQAGAGTAVLRGNLCPNGAVIKQSAATAALLKHRGRAVVFDTIDEYRARIDDPALDIDPSCVIVLRNVGPRGYPGMPEVGNVELPARLLAAGVTDMVRISDARMSGTGYGTVVLHVAPEAAVGGPLALVRDDDMIELDVPARRLHLDVPEEELRRRASAWQPRAPLAERGYVRLYADHILQADRGADFDFLVGGSGSAVPRHSH